MKKRGGGGDEGGSWMDTYGDLVTLLFAFFVLLYSMSSVDNQKWDLFVRSIYPDGKTPSEKVAEQVVINGEVTEDAEDGRVGNPEVDKSLITDTDVTDLYIQIAQKLNEAGAEGVTVSRGKDYTFVAFKDHAFFEGDSSVLTENGERTMKVFCDAIAPEARLISQINIMGHTSQADPDKPNNARNDRILSSMRAAEVCIFIQNQNIIAPEKLVSIGYGQYRPLESNSTPEGRAANRRVEILLIDKDASVRDMDEYYNDLNNGVNKDTTIVTDGHSDTDEGLIPQEDTSGILSDAGKEISSLILEAGNIGIYPDSSGA